MKMVIQIRYSLKNKIYTTIQLLGSTMTQPCHGMNRQIKKALNQNSFTRGRIQVVLRIMLNGRKIQIGSCHKSQRKRLKCLGLSLEMHQRHSICPGALQLDQILCQRFQKKNTLKAPGHNNNFSSHFMKIPPNSPSRRRLKINRRDVNEHNQINKDIWT